MSVVPQIEAASLVGMAVARLARLGLDGATSRRARHCVADCLEIAVHYVPWDE